MSGYAPSNYNASVNSVRVLNKGFNEKNVETGNLSEDNTMAAMSQTNFSKTGMKHYRDNIFEDPLFNIPQTPQSNYFRRSDAYAKRPPLMKLDGPRKVNLSKKIKNRKLSPQYMSENGYKFSRN